MCFARRSLRVVIGALLMVASPSVRAQVCGDDGDCADVYTCTVDRCGAGGTCEWTPDDGACDDHDACTVDACSHDSGCSHATRDCDDGVACTVEACDPILGCQIDFDDAACDDGDPCTVDACNRDGCAHVTRPDGALVAAGVPCEDAGLCSAALGETRCQDGAAVTTCDDAVMSIIALDIGDDACDTREVAYVIVSDTLSGDPVGTVRCWRDRATHVVDCDRVAPGSSEVKVYAALLCPGE